LERDEPETVTRLTAETKLLGDLAVPERVELKPTGRTVGEVYSTMSFAEPREAL
jgi:hypothetical protein